VSADDQREPAPPASAPSRSPTDPNWNPLLEKWKEYHPGERRRRDWLPRAREDLEMASGGLGARRDLCRNYAWAVPTPEALDAIAALGPIVEIGAGTGYWAMMLQLRRCTVYAYDSHPPYGEEGEDANHYHQGVVCWTSVRKGGPEKVNDHPGATLFLCWPPYNEPMAAEALALYRGERVIYIGEGPGGCTADDAFHDAIEAHWEAERMIAIPQWWGIHDVLEIYKRKGT
jgi:hypothetical protein